jgi:putative endonuclease
VNALEETKATAPARDWCVYLLTCADGTFYCGVTNDLPRRLDMHNGRLTGGAKYTRGRRPVALTACTEGLTQGEALRLEARVKKAPRAAKVALLTASCKES